MKIKKGLVVTSISLLAAMAFAGCSPNTGGDSGNTEFDINMASWDEIVEEAKKEGEVTLYMALANFEPIVLEGFQEAYPEIKLTIVREPSGSLITKALAEKDAPGSAGGDVVLLSDFRFFEDYNADLAEPKGPSPALYEGVDQTGGNNYFTTVTTPFTIVSNPEVLEEIGAHEISDYPDLLQPELKGLIGITRPDITPVEAQLQREIYEAQGDEFFEQLIALEPRLGDSSGTLSQQVAAGDLAVAIGASAITTHILASEGAPISDPAGMTPAVVFGYAAGILGWSERPAAAQVMLEWLISEQGQGHMHNWKRSLSVLPSVPNKTGIDPERIYTGVMSDEDTAFIENIWTKYF